MTDQEIVDLKLSLAKAWLDNGQEQLARDIISNLINDGLDKNK